MNDLLELLEATAERIPDDRAFFTDKAVLTFGSLKACARAVGSRLLESTCHGDVVALLIDSRSLDNIPAMFGVLYAGCAYAPLDIAMPAERLKLLIDLMQPKAILADAKGSLAAQAAGLTCISFADAAAHEVCDAALSEARSMIKPTDAVSVLYTSGSTGIPKGSVQTHDSYLRWTQATIDIYGFTDATVFANQSPYFYANSIIDIFPPVQLGAQVYLLPAGALTFPKMLIERLNSNKITELTMTPSSFVAVANSGVLESVVCPYLRYGIMSGEAMPIEPLKKWMQATPNAGWWHFYGSTEMFSVSVGRVNGIPANGRFPSGRPFAGVNLLILDENGNRVPDGEPGELYVSSPWVAQGYYRDPERTEKSWVTDPDGCGTPGRWYRSGDFGFIAPDGQLTVLGRADSQIKHNGYRMELGEVEAAVRTVSEVTESCVLFDRENDLIWCFYTGSCDEKQLRKLLNSKLARYMVPDRFSRLEEMPHTSSMKQDRAKLTGMMKKGD